MGVGLYIYFEIQRNVAEKAHGGGPARTRTHRVYFSSRQSVRELEFEKEKDTFPPSLLSGYKGYRCVFVVLMVLREKSRLWSCVFRQRRSSETFLSSVG